MPLPNMGASSTQPSHPERVDDAVLSVECLAHLGLGKQPFTSNVDSFIYTDPALEMPVNVALEHLRDRSAPVLIKGEQGIGKTTLLKRLQHKASGDLHFCPIESGADISMAAVDYCIRLQWQPRPAHGDPRKLSVSRYLFALMHDNVLPVLVLDDAQLLEPQVLAGLLELKSEMRSEYGEELGLVLSAEPSIESKLEQISKTTPMVSNIYTIALRPLNRDQIRAYLEHRLRAAGATRIDLSDDELIAIQSESGGLPGRLNLAACQAIEARCGGGISRRARKNGRGAGRMVSPAAIGVVVVGLLVALIGVLGGLLNEPEPEDSIQEIALAVPPPEPPPVPEIAESVVDEPTSTPEPPTPEPSIAPSPIERPASALDSPAPKETPFAAPPPQPPSGPGADEVTSMTPAKAPRSEPLAASPVPPGPDALLGPDWLKRQNPEHFTVQILGVGSEAALTAYYASHKLSEPMAYYRTDRGGKGWYVLLAGVYPDADTARRAIASFPAAIRDNNPWIRRIGDIQRSTRP